MGRQFRLVHVGVAVAMAAATVTAVGLVDDARAVGTGTASVYVPIVPCRLVDTRSDSPVGTRSMPLGPAETVTFAVWGTNGNCSISTTATAIATNATAVNPTSASYVTIFPADAEHRPTASNLNVVAAGAPTPNQVTVALSAAGAISAYNNGGTVDLIIDIVGYYEPATSGPQGPQGPQGPAGPTCPAGGCSLVVLGLAAATNFPSTVDGAGCRVLDVNSSAYLPLDLPAGAKIIAATVRYSDTNAGTAQYNLSMVTVPGSATTTVGSAVFSINGQLTGSFAIASPLTPVGPAAVPMISALVSASGTQKLCGASVTYTF